MFSIINTPGNYFTRELLQDSNVAFHCKKSLAAILGGKLSEKVFCRPSTAPVAIIICAYESDGNKTLPQLVPVTILSSSCVGHRHPRPVDTRPWSYQQCLVATHRPQPRLLSSAHKTACKHCESATDRNRQLIYTYLNVSHCRSQHKNVLKVKGKGKGSV